MPCINPATGEWTYDESICAAIDQQALQAAAVQQAAVSAGIPVSAIDPVTLSPQWEEVYSPAQLAYLAEIQRLKQQARNPTMNAVTSILAGATFLIGGAAAPLTATAAVVGRAALSASAESGSAAVETSLQSNLTSMGATMNGDTGTGFDILPYLQAASGIVSGLAPIGAALLQRPATTPAQFNAGPYVPLQLAATPAMSTLPRVLGTSAITGVVAGGGAVIRAIAARVAAYVGRRVTASQALALARRVGLDAAAAALGISVVELAQWSLHSSVSKRRRRGITGRQIANARSTIRRMTGFMAQVQSACAPAMRRRASRHRAGCGCVVCRRAA